ncbi:MAG: PRC-barrel domain-containing protein [Gammaproteobacteria bacterium]|nr:PRC-barrel domain-containing protein [Gammaproteobacteria bacterium]
MLRPTILWAALCTVTAAAAAAEPFEFPSRADVGKAGELLGTRVETPEGEELGRVSDFAIDLDSGRIAYVVVSVGSFLIEDSLIAVDPAALETVAADSDRLVIHAEAATLRAARRFSAGDWPLTADVTGTRREPAGQSGDGAAPRQDAPADRGRATISDGRKTATLSAGKRRIQLMEPEEPAPAADPADGAGIEGKAVQGGNAAADEAPRREPDTRFGRLDRDGDGTLNRAEIAHELSRDDRFADIDRDGDGVIDAGEFDLWQEDGASTDAANR